MTKVVNFRQARKQKARAAKDRAAEQNRLLHGRSKAEKLRDRQTADKSNAYLDGHRREPTGGKGPI
jgi:Domain of unknown function (DUF4169)